MRGRKGQTSNRVMRYAIGILVTAIVVAQVAIPVVTDSLVLSTNTVTNETVASSGSVPDVFTVSTVEDGLAKGSETLYLKDSFDGTTYVLDDPEYKVDYPAGEFNVTDADLDDDGNPEINSTSDTYNATFDYKPTGYIESTASRTILGFVTLMLAVA
ncbi:MAG: hypothetical protein SVS85_04260, partial [Candidatus Nanohaloarchaea archaeon]|nr:hypothetical protein [Candidatus Nanohaloarchaea archaeon]